MGWNVFRKGMMAVGVTPVVLGVVLAVGACGVKSSPRFPEGGSYPRVYLYAVPKHETALPPASSSSSASSAPLSPAAPDKTRESDRGQRSPLGFPLEYPNRPSYN
jgi:hypothetical protein